MANRNLPAKKGQSREIQRQHVRRYDSGKATVVNRGVNKKDSTPVAPRRPTKLKPRAPAKPPIQVPPKTEAVKIRPRKRWEDIFHKMTPAKVRSMEMEKLKKKAAELGIRQDENNPSVWLVPYERSFKRFVKIISRGSGLADIVFEKWDGTIESILTECRMSQASLWNGLVESNNKPMIVQVIDDDVLGDTLKWFNYSRPYEPVPLKDLIEHVEERIRAYEAGENNFRMYDHETGEEIFNLHERQAKLNRYNGQEAARKK